MTTGTNRKYRSFIVSCLLHAFLFLALFYTKMQQNPEQLFPPTKTPAKIHLERSFPQSTPQDQPIETAEIDEPVHKMNYEEAQSTPKKQPQGGDSASQEYTHLDGSSGSDHTQPIGQGEPHRSISPEIFMKAFTTAMQHEQGSTSVRSSQDTFRGPDHVKERLKEWAHYHYKEKLYNALRRASKFAATTMHHERSLEKVAQISVTIKKDGTLGRISKNHLSGIKEVDEHLLKVLQTADFPPIPDRYGTDTFVFTLPIRISLQAGSGVYRLFV